MSSDCKGVCDSNNESQRRFGYENGQKYCPKCTRYFFTELTICYCCKNKLRTKSREYRKTKITIP
ncbi:MAG TPA: hypothetical protein VIH04_09660 [Nitrosarchaeum sp.]